ncbi:MAG TPA: cytochrome b/b6 domain-containing protein [Rubrivivax sp.]|nr:cytochrome b/b6 domain-containing protein [Rubrivivax sp.]
MTGLHPNPDATLGFRDAEVALSILSLAPDPLIVIVAGRNKCGLNHTTEGQQMTLKSTAKRYGAVVVTIHWLTAALILALLGIGFSAAFTLDAGAKVALLRWHLPLGIAVLVVTVARIIWWWAFDTRPDPIAGSPAWQERIAWLVHRALYVAILAQAGFGIALVATSGAAPAIFDGPPAALPDFARFPAAAGHAVMGVLLAGLVALHVGAALFHQFIQRDHLLRRMWC